MKINGLNGGFNPYSVKKINMKAKKPINGVRDKIELSNLGKTLQDFSNDFKEENRVEMVRKIKVSIENGTYKIDAKALTRKFIECMGAKNYAN